MSSSVQRVRKVKNEMLKERSISLKVADTARNRHLRIEPRVSLPTANAYTNEGQQTRIAYLNTYRKNTIQYLTGNKNFDEYDKLRGNIENYIGMAQVPVGLAGPIRVNGTAASGDYHIPMSTTEGALVASYHRGMKVCNKSGAVRSVCLEESVQRSPFFGFASVSDAAQFVAWVYQHVDKYKFITQTVSRYAQLKELKANIEGNHVILTFDFTTGDASGQNMVTICTQAICEYLMEHSPCRPETWYIESNYSGDKKATSSALANVRGKKVTAEINIPREIVERFLHTTPEKMEHYWRTSTMATIKSGTIGAQGHMANGLAALFIACGQDVACVAEASAGITRMELPEKDTLYVSVTLPNLIVGTVGGGTGLPTQRECLEIMNCYGAGKARQFAEVCAAVVLAGEISIAGAMAAGHFARAHKKHGRK
ncbi:MAG: hydroxymethylglutaryl-CoA reductase [Bacteroidales bacterium]|nr:hydroxymethylglutaryl-CoA reductase [Bacteroidales bacterium]